MSKLSSQQRHPLEVNWCVVLYGIKLTRHAVSYSIAGFRLLYPYDINNCSAQITINQSFECLMVNLV